jgi:hypothetical protein
MRFHIGPIPEDTDFDPGSSGWSPIREPKPWLLMVIATPIGFILAVAVAGLWALATPVETVSAHLSIFGILICLGVLVLVHEGVHALTHPGAGFSSKSLIGIWPSQLVFYAAYMGETSRERFLAIFLMPLMVISFVPLAVGAITQWVYVELVAVSVVNAFLSCWDVVGAALVATQVPKGAITRNQRWETYWRPASKVSKL